MFANIIALLVVLYVISRIVKAGYLTKLAEFLGLVKTSVKTKGGRGTTHDVVDAIFNNADGIKSAVKAGAGKVTGVAKTKVEGLKAQDYEFDAKTGELIIFLSREQDLVLGRNSAGNVYAIEVNVNGTEVELNAKAFERRINKLVRAKKLSDSQQRALKDFMILGRKEAQDSANDQRTRIPRGAK